MVILVKLEHPEKAELPIVVTLLGMVILVKLEQPEKAELAIVVTLLGITKFVTNSSFTYNLCAHNNGLSLNVILHQEARSLIYTDDKAEQFLNADDPIFFTLLGIATEVNWAIPEHKEDGITSTELPKENDFILLPKLYPLQFLAFHTISVILLQLAKAEEAILLKCIGIVMDLNFVQLLKALSPILVT